MIKIFNPLWIKDDRTCFSISQWNFDKEKGDKVSVIVYNGNKIAGEGEISKKEWIKTAKLKESKVVYRPNEPLVFYYNVLKFIKQPTAQEKFMENVGRGVYG